MIVTRRRRKPFPWKRLLLPAVAIALVIFAFSWGPSRSVITNGPMAPMWQNLGQRFGVIAAPFRFAAQNQLLTDKNKQIAKLQAQVAALRSQSTAKDKKISALSGQVDQLQTQAANAQASAPAPLASTNPANPAAANPADSGAAASGGQSNATPQMRRTAQVWANMEPENAAKVIQRLPIPYVAQVLALMSPDDAGAILDAVPPKFAAEVTQENPGIRR